MIYLKGYKIFESDTNQFFKTKEETKKWLDDLGIKNYTINDNLSVDVDGDIKLIYRELDHIPVQFGNVDGGFYCYGNRLKDLKGCPKYVSNYFNCSENQLTSLEGCPNEVDAFYCSNNKLTSLKGCPKIIRECFECNYNKLTSLEDGPIEVGEDYICSNNQLVNLKGSPIQIGGDFLVNDNKLISLEGCPNKIVGYLQFVKNPISELLHLIPEKDLKIFIKYLNEYRVIQNNNLILDNLKEALYMIDIQESFDYRRLYTLNNYKIID